MSKTGKILTFITYDTFEEAVAECDGRYGTLCYCDIDKKNDKATLKYVRELPENESKAEPHRAPKPLPAHIKARAEISFETDDLPALSAILNNIDNYWPGMHMYQYGFTQKVGAPAIAIATIINYSNEEEDRQEGPNLTIQTIEEVEYDNDDDDELGDIMYNE